MANIPAMTEAAEEAAASGTTAGTRLDRDSLLTAGMAVMGFALFLSAVWTARNEAALVPDGALYTARFVKAVACFAIAFTLRSHIPSVGKFFALGAGFVGMHLVAYGLGALMPAGVAEYLAASVISGAFSGIGEACVIVLFAHLFSTYAPRVSAVAIPVAYLLNEALYFSTLYLPTEAIMALRPAGKLLGVVLLGLCLRRKERLPLADNEYPLQYGISIKSAGERAITLFATHRSWALIIAGSTLFPLIFGFVAQACSRLSTNSGLYDGFNEIVALGTIALLVFYGVWRAGRLTFDELLYFSVPLFATGCLLLPAFWLADAPYAGMLVKCGYTVNQVLFWVLLAQESYRDLRHTYLFFGLFYGIYELTTAAARLTTSALYAEGGIDFTFMVYVALWRCGSSPAMACCSSRWRNAWRGGAKEVAALRTRRFRTSRDPQAEAARARRPWVGRRFPCGWCPRRGGPSCFPTSWRSCASVTGSRRGRSRCSPRPSTATAWRTSARSCSCPARR